MILYSEKWEHPPELIQTLKQRYDDPFFLKGGEDSIENRKNWGQHYTGFHKNPNNKAPTVEGNFIDKDLLQLYVPKLKKILGDIGLPMGKTIYSYSSIWGQLYKLDLEAVIDVHNHYEDPHQLISWVHFVDVPDTKLFYFQVGDNKFYPECQKSGDLMLYPSYAMHGVDKMTEGLDRFVVVGNIVKLNQNRW